MSREYYVTVKVLSDDDVRLADVQEYVLDAVNCWGGSYYPSHAFFGDNKTVTLGKCGRVHAKPVKKRLTDGEKLIALGEIETLRELALKYGFNLVDHATYDKLRDTYREKYNGLDDSHQEPA